MTTNPNILEIKVLKNKITTGIVKFVNARNTEEEDKCRQILGTYLQSAEKFFNKYANFLQPSKWNLSTGGGPVPVIDKEKLLQILKETDVSERVKMLSSEIKTKVPNYYIFSVTASALFSLIMTCKSVIVTVALAPIPPALIMFIPTYVGTVASYAVTGYTVYELIKYKQNTQEQIKILNSFCDATGNVIHMINSLSTINGPTEVHSRLYAILLSVVCNREPDLIPEPSSDVLPNFLDQLIDMTTKNQDITISHKKLFFDRVVYFPNNQSYNDLLKFIRTANSKLTFKMLLDIYIQCSVYQGVLCNIPIDSVDTITRDTTQYPYNVVKKSTNNLKTNTKTIQNIEKLFSPSNSPCLGIEYWKQNKYFMLSQKFSVNEGYATRVFNGTLFNSSRGGAKPKKKTVNKPVKENPYRMFMKKHLLEGKKMAEVAAMWRKTKS